VAIFYGRGDQQYAGWWLTYPSEKYESQLGLLFPIDGQIKKMVQTTNQNMNFGYVQIGVHQTVIFPNTFPFTSAEHLT